MGARPAPWAAPQELWRKHDRQATRLAATLALKRALACAQGTGLTYSSRLMAVGRATAAGVLVHGRKEPLGMTGFEALAGSSAHRPAQFTFTSSGPSLQVQGPLLASVCCLI